MRISHAIDRFGAIARVDDVDRPELVKRGDGRNDVLRWSMVVMRSGVAHRVTVEADVSGLMAKAIDAVGNKSGKSCAAMVTAKVR
jgi:hypothetical protein